MTASTAAHAKRYAPVMQYLKIIPTTGLAKKHIPPFQRKYTLSFPIYAQDAGV